MNPYLNDELNVNQWREKKRLQGLGIVSGVGLLIFVFGLTLITVSYSDILNNFWDFLFKGPGFVEDGSRENALTIFMTVLAINVVDLVLAILIFLLLRKKFVIGNDNKLLEFISRGPLLLLRVVTLEELFARYLFLGILTQVFTGTAAFYILMLIGNALWALFHLSNHKHNPNRSVILVLPQFVGGFFLAYLYVRYGLWITILAHFWYDIMLFTVFKKIVLDKSNIYIFLYHSMIAIVMLVAIFIREISFSNLSSWINGDLTTIASMTFAEYAILLVFLECLIVVVSQILLLDFAMSQESKFLITRWWFIPLAVVMELAIILGGYHALGFVTDSEMTKLIVVSFAVGVLSFSKSGSAMTRTTLIRIPVNYIAAAALLTVSIPAAAGLCAITSAVGIIPYFFTKPNQ